MSKHQGDPPTKIYKVEIEHPHHSYLTKTYEVEATSWYDAKRKARRLFRTETSLEPGAAHKRGEKDVA